MSTIVIAIHAPHAGREQEVRDLLDEHLQLLRARDYITGRDRYLAQSTSGAFVEVFEWASEAACQTAHTDPDVHRLWNSLQNCCTYGRLQDLPEADQVFPNFTVLADRD